jgi:hypothetical protein
VPTSRQRSRLSCFTTVVHLRVCRVCPPTTIARALRGASDGSFSEGIDNAAAPPDPRGAHAPSAGLAHCRPCTLLGHSWEPAQQALWQKVLYAPVSLCFLYAHWALEQVIALGGLLYDPGQILGQQVSLRHQRLGGLFHPSQVVFLGKIALLDGGTRVA